MKNKKRTRAPRPGPPIPPDEKDVVAFRAEIGAAKVDLHTEPLRRAEYGVISCALAGSEGFAGLIRQFGELLEESLIEDDERMGGDAYIVAIIAAVSTGIQLGMDIQKKRGTNGGPTGTSIN
jgi:hypothetical protein